MIFRVSTTVSTTVNTTEHGSAFSKLLPSLSRPLIASLVIAGASLVGAHAVAEDYYRWKGDDGVIHYGSLPPHGVEAVKVKTYSNPSAKAPDEQQSNGADKQQAAIEARKQQCLDEKARLDTLRSSGTRIRMTQPDGTTKYLTPEEVATEISSSEDFINQACGGK